MYARRSARWRYLSYANGEEELYDLKNDPNEWDNRINDTRLTEVRARLAKGLAPAGECDTGFD